MEISFNWQSGFTHCFRIQSAEEYLAQIGNYLQLLTGLLLCPLTCIPGWGQAKREYITFYHFLILISFSVSCLSSCGINVYSDSGKVSCSYICYKSCVYQRTEKSDKRVPSSSELTLVKASTGLAAKLQQMSHLIWFDIFMFVHFIVLSWTLKTHLSSWERGTPKISCICLSWGSFVTHAC